MKVPCEICGEDDNSLCSCPHYTGEEPFECKICGALKGQHLFLGLKCSPEHLSMAESERGYDGTI